MITYKTNPKTEEIEVRVEGKLTGFILPRRNGWRYKVKGEPIYGDTFPTVQEVKRSLEGEDDAQAA